MSGNRSGCSIDASERSISRSVGRVAGHALGLPHCPTLGCLMDDAEGKVVTVEHQRNFCARCRQQATQSGCSIKEPVGLPW